MTTPKTQVTTAKADAGLRYNDGKPKYAMALRLVSMVALRGLTAVLEFGAKKYAADNWKKGLSWNATVDSLMRHLIAFVGGENIDPESGLPHVHHIQCNAMFLAHFYETKTGTDDRVKPDVGTPAAQVRIETATVKCSMAGCTRSVFDNGYTLCAQHLR